MSRSVAVKLTLVRVIAVSSDGVTVSEAGDGVDTTTSTPDAELSPRAAVTVAVP